MQSPPLHTRTTTKRGIYKSFVQPSIRPSFRPSIHPSMLQRHQHCFSNLHKKSTTRENREYVTYLDSHLCVCVCMGCVQVYLYFILMEVQPLLVVDTIRAHHQMAPPLTTTASPELQAAGAKEFMSHSRYIQRLTHIDDQSTFILSQELCCAAHVLNVCQYTNP